MHKRLALTIAILFAQPLPAQESPSAQEIMDAWLASPHANASSTAFTYWNEAGEIPGTCAVCHSTTGFAEYVAGPMERAGIIDHPVPTGTVVECAACHDPNVASLAQVIFPSGIAATPGAASAACTVCHQGRTSMENVVTATATLQDDEVSPELTFINIHYSAAAATQMGSEVRGGFQYEGRDYAVRFGHVPGLDTCASCHGGHDVAVELPSCTTCHAGADDFRAIRTTATDILGRGDTGAGIASVIDELQMRLRDALALYATEVAGMPIHYADRHPYFFADAAADSSVEPVAANRYQNWTPRLLRAAYNYQFVKKDHGAFAHNPHYAIQLMIDSLEDLATQVDVDVAGLARP